MLLFVRCQSLIFHAQLVDSWQLVLPEWQLVNKIEAFTRTVVSERRYFLTLPLIHVIVRFFSYIKDARKQPLGILFEMNRILFKPIAMSIEK